MKILHINSYYYASLFYKSFFNKQKELGLDIDVFVPVSNGIQVNDFDYGEYTNISVNHNKWDRIVFHLKHYKILKDIKSKYNINEFTYLHAHSLFSNGYIAYKLNQEFGIPYMVAVRRADVITFFEKMIHLRKMGINILLNADKVIFISDTYKEKTFDKYIPNKYRIDIESKSYSIPNGVSPFWLTNAVTNKKGPKENSIRLIYVGIIDSNKNIETTIKVCEKLIKEGFDVSFTIVGEIKNDKYIDIINQYEFINYISHCPKEELIEHYRTSDIFIMPSKHETFGLVYVEAMSQGLPVIYTRQEGFDGQFEEGQVGYSVQYNSESEIVLKIKLILDNYSQISKACIQNIDDFDWGKITGKYIGLYI